MKSRIEPLVLAALLATVVLWASAFAGIRVGLEGYGPGQVALLRFLVASAALALYALLTRMRLPESRDLPAIFFAGFLAYTVYHVALNYGERTVSAGAASLLINTAPVFTALFTALLAAGFLGERLRVLGWVGMAVSFTGAALISLGEGEGFSLDPSALLIVLSAVCTSIYFVFQRPYLQKYGALAFTTYAIWAGTLPMLLYLPGLLSQASAAPPDVTLAVAYLGVFPTAVAYVLYGFAMSRMSATSAVSFLYLVPVLAYLIAWVWIGERPTALSIVGGVLALSGVIIVNRFGRK